MAIDLSFKEIGKFIKDGNPELADDVDTLFSLIVVVSTVTLNAPSAGIIAAIGLLANFIEVKNELSRLGRNIINKVRDKRDDDSLSKLRRMEVTYHLLCYTAFFEAVEKTFPEIVKKAGLTAQDKISISKSALDRLKFDSSQAGKLVKSPELMEFEARNSLAPFPNPVESFEFQKDKLLRFYGELTKLDFIHFRS